MIAETGRLELLEEAKRQTIVRKFEICRALSLLFVIVRKINFQIEAPNLQ